MRLSGTFLSLALVCIFAFARQVVLSSDQDISVLQLSSLSSSTYTRFSHPAFPGRSARIKKTDFCDGGVNTYTGYIDVGTRHLFFYFFESRSDPEKDDVLLWTNGGPGGSSTVGLFMELGPCRIMSSNETKFNPYSWNSNANIFFIDQPVGVGFSYADYGETVTTTEEAAVDVAAFVATFFERFDKFKGRGFHLSGESYGGRYLPVYGSVIYDQNVNLVEKGLTPINLKSVAIGNGATDFFALMRSYHTVQCSDASVEPFQSISSCVRMRQAIPRCERWAKAACVNVFDQMSCAAAFSFCAEELMIPYMQLGRNGYDMTMVCEQDLCYPEQAFMEAYLNREDIRQEIGVDDAAGNYSMMSLAVNQAFWAAGDPFYQNQHYVAELLERGVRVLIYVGTYDFVCNWVGNERWTLDMPWSGQEAFKKKALIDWTVDGHVAGKTRSHGAFTFATINGAGHLAPHDKPVESLAMINRWLAEETL